MTPTEQLELWVNGESVHNNERDECCPDFSCCNKKVNTPIEVRKKFQDLHQKGDEEGMWSMLSFFLDVPDVYTVDGNPKRTEH